MILSERATACALFGLIAGAQAATVYLAGDSTMANGGGGNGTKGWGEYLQSSLSIPVVNAAVAGRSARSYTREGRFTALAAIVISGDFVVIEFGHNDGGSLTPTDNGRTDCPGAGGETCSTTYDGIAETVLTYPAYLTNAVAVFVAAGASVMLSSPTPNNPWETGDFAYPPNRFTTYASAVANSTGQVFIDHGQYTANRYKVLGATAVDAFFPNDHTYTSAVCASEVALAWVRGLLCGSGALRATVNVSSEVVPGSCI